MRLGRGKGPSDEMPERPLHPNCRCTVEDILDYAKVMGGQDEWGDDDARQPAENTPEPSRKPFTSDEVSPRLHHGAKTAFGVNWCNDGRRVWDGPGLWQLGRAELGWGGEHYEFKPEGEIGVNKARRTSTW